MTDIPPLTTSTTNIATGNLNEKVRASAPELASANDVFSSLKDLQEKVKNFSGKNLQNGETVMKNLFNSNKSQDIQNLFSEIKDKTGIDLQKHATFAQHAIDTYGSDKVGSSVVKGLLEGKTGYEAGKDVLSATLKKKLANPETIGREILKGNPQGTIGKLGGKNLITKGVLEAKRGLLGQ